MALTRFRQFMNQRKQALIVAVVVAVGGGLGVGALTSHTKVATKTVTITPAPPSRNFVSSFKLASNVFPNASNVGVPAGTVLTNYTGSTTFASCGTVIDSKTISGIETNIGNGTDATKPCLTIKNSKITGDVDDHYTSYSGCGGHVCGPLVIMNSEIDDNQPNAPCVKETNIILINVYVHGCRTAVQCDGYCDIENSYLVADKAVQGAHMGAFLSNGNSGNPITVNHSTLLCTAPAGLSSGGCSADANFYGDFGTIKNVTFTNNLLKANVNDFYYCAYTGASQSAKPNPTGTNLVWTGNVFERGGTAALAPPFLEKVSKNLSAPRLHLGLAATQSKCGGANAVADWAPNAGNVWCNNTWDDGTPMTDPAPTANCSVVTTTTTVTVPVTTTTIPVTTTTTKPVTTTTKPPVTTTTVAPTTTTQPVTTTTTVPPTTTTTVPPIPSAKFTCVYSGSKPPTLVCVGA